MHHNMQVLKKVGYEHMIVPDHAPGNQAGEDYRQAWAYQFGYINAMIQAVMDEFPGDLGAWARALRVGRDALKRRIKSFTS